MTSLRATKPLLLGAWVGILLAGVLALLLGAGLGNDVIASVVPTLVNCVAAGSLAARCIAR
jgi:hypothetical protein